MSGLVSVTEAVREAILLSRPAAAPEIVIRSSVHPAGAFACTFTVAAVEDGRVYHVSVTPMNGEAL